MILTRYGIREWAIATVIALALAVVLALLGWWGGIVPVAVLWFAVASFFRDPVRRLPPDLDTGDMISPSDGVISAVEHVFAHKATDDGPAIIIRTFLSVLNVHVIRAPFDATVEAKLHTPGRYINAQKPQSAALNEQTLLTLRPTIAGYEQDTIGLKLIAGMVARRIVCPLEVGDTVRRGAKFGMIKFGSTTELILPRPSDVTVHVKVGDRVRGGRTILATLKPRSM
jgi:phosphatidylserine decarboxylase